jgi:hypothetical protein
VLFVERGPFAGTLFADPLGQSAASSIAAAKAWTIDDPRWLTVADRVCARVARGKLTWWEQPAPAPLASPPPKTSSGSAPLVVLFASQVEEDSQGFLFAPQFSDNLAAFEWLLTQLRRRDDVYVLGKHHPKSNLPPRAYERILAASGVPGRWTTDLSIDDALRAADRVAAVNSTVVFEALARGVPALTLGNWLLSGRGVAHEVSDPARDGGVVDRWLDAADHDVRMARWREHLAFVLSKSLYAYQPDAWGERLNGADALAGRIAALAPADAAWTAPPHLVTLAVRELADATGWGQPWEPHTWATPDHRRFGAEAWGRAFGLRYHLLGARAQARAGRRVVIWGAGRAGRALHELLRAAGVTVAGFVVSAPGGLVNVDGLPVWAPDKLCGGTDRDFVLIASTAAEDIVGQLSSLGYIAEVDFRVVACDALAEQSGEPLRRAC